MIFHFKGIKYKCWLVVTAFYWANASFAINSPDTIPVSTRQQAIDFIEHIGELKKSMYWPNIKPSQFLQNIKENIYSPRTMYEGSNTNFCSYAALSWLPLHDDPLGFAKRMIKLYAEGRVTYGNILLEPSRNVRLAAGTLKFKGILDIRAADQVWFLSLADHFKGYLNLFNRHYDQGDENRFWAATNYAKFNRMIRQLFGYKITTRGADLVHPRIFDLYGYIRNKLRTGTTLLYLNNAYLHKKKHNTLRPGVPTHYVVLLDIYKNDNGLITVVYWDYGFYTLRQLTPSFLQKIVFGITHCAPKNKDERK